MNTRAHRCFTCGKVLRWVEYFEKLDTSKETAAKKTKVLDDMGYARLCCRRMFIGHAKELEDNLAYYA